MNLSVRHVSKNFNKIKALQDICFEIGSGQVVALLGENGAGKSTLLRLLAGFYEADSGKIILAGKDIRENRKEYLQMIGYVPEISALYSDMAVYDFLEFAAKIRQLPIDVQTERIAKIIADMDLKNVLGQKNGTLSKGYKKRVELAAALLAEPKLLLLDEPTEGLDPNQKQILRRIIKDYAKEHMVIISTHVLEDVEAMASQVLLIHQGKLLMHTHLQQFKNMAGQDLWQSFCSATKN